MTDDDSFFQPRRLYQTGQIVDVIGLAVAAPFRPVGIAVTAKVRGNDIKGRRRACPARRRARRCHSEFASSISPNGSQLLPLQRCSCICVQIMLLASEVFILMPGEAVGSRKS